MGVGIIAAIHGYNQILVTVAVLLAILEAMGETADPVHFVPTGIVGVCIQIAIFVITGYDCRVNRFMAFLAVEKQDIAGLNAGVLGFQRMNAVSRDLQRSSTSQPGVQKRVPQRIHATGQNFHAAGLQTIFHKLVADTDSVIPVGGGIGDRSLIVITRTEFRSADGHRQGQHKAKNNQNQCGFSNCIFEHSHKFNSFPDLYIDNNKVSYFTYCVPARPNRKYPAVHRA